MSRSTCVGLAGTQRTALRVGNEEPRNTGRPVAHTAAALVLSPLMASTMSDCSFQSEPYADVVPGCPWRWQRCGACKVITPPLVCSCARVVHVGVRLYQAPSTMRVALQCVLAALGLASMSLQVSAWGPITHYRMTCGGVQPSTSVAACASSPANADLIVGSDLPDAFYFVRHQDVRCGTCGGPVSSRGRGRCLTFGCWCVRESSSRDLAAPDHGHCTISVRHHHGCRTVTGHDLHCLVQSTLGTR